MPCCRITPLDAAFTIGILILILIPVHNMISLIGSLETMHSLEHAGSKDDPNVYRSTCLILRSFSLFTFQVINH